MKQRFFTIKVAVDVERAEIMMHEAELDGLKFNSMEEFIECEMGWVSESGIGVNEIKEEQ